MTPFYDVLRGSATTLLYGDVSELYVSERYNIAYLYIQEE